ncbi:alpha/beta hydrolase [Tsuneonella mangrovi]|uniref:alpha/beta hydrolase n=1 Tax=Tsuneonella mangrovi TaxID=1982042 RepID=UPI000BA2976B|nr:alpha/beta hydrolase [Tsuneonella mangrovi]
MRFISPILLAIAAVSAVPAHARTVVTQTVVEEWVEVDTPDNGAGRFVASEPAAIPAGIASFGPFRVLDGRRAALVDATDAASPRAFSAMLRAYPQIAELEMVECPGTDDDVANLKLGRMIRAAGLVTHVPAGGSVRSGAVELFLAGKQRKIDDGAEFAVHSWVDSDGRQPGDFAANAQVNETYIDYYEAMGMSAHQARSFYDMTNSVPNADARWLTAQDMRGWISAGSGSESRVVAKPAEPKIAYLDLGQRIP